MVANSENSCDVKYERNIDKANRLGVGEKQALEMCLFRSGIKCFFEDLIIFIKHELLVFLAKGNHCPVVQDYIVEEASCLFARFVTRALVKLKFGLAHTPKHHEGTRTGDNQGHAP